jgi:hypothetical protein
MEQKARIFPSQRAERRAGAKLDRSTCNANAAADDQQSKKRATGTYGLVGGRGSNVGIEQ